MKFCDLIFFAGCLTTAGHASALSLGPSHDGLILGTPINMSFDVLTDSPSESAEDVCARAQVWLGDVPIPENQVHLQGTKNKLRLRTTAVINEPLVTVKLTAGCSATVTRSYTLFADPPKALAAMPQPIDLKSIAPVLVSRPAQGNTASPAKTTASERKPKPQAAQKSPPSSKTASTGKQAAPAAAVAAASAIAAPKTETPASDNLAALPPVQLRERSALRMEPVLNFDPEELQASKQTHSASDSGDGLPSATDQPTDAYALRLESLEKQLQQLQQQLKKNHAEASNLKAQLEQAKNTDLPFWVYVLLGALALAIATIGWLIQKLRQEQQRAQQAWEDTVLSEQIMHGPILAAHKHEKEVAPAAFGDVDIPAPPPLAPGEIRQGSFSEAVLRPHAPLEDVTDQHSALRVEVVSSKEDSVHSPVSVNASHEAEAQETVNPSDSLSDTTLQAQSLIQLLSAQALLDVQEEAEFYASIGENDQAISLLQEHIAAHEKSSPLAYLELLNLLYRLSRTEAFEQTKEQFQQYFNVQVPDFLGFSRKGNDLWSSRPDALAQIEACWPSDEVLPLLRSLLLLHSESEPRFNLAAFDDLLLLYNVAQTTNASERGSLQQRMRTTPLDVPLPEVPLADSAQTAASTAGYGAAFVPDTLFDTADAAVNIDLSSAAPNSLNMLSLNAMEFTEPLTSLESEDLSNDSPFLDVSHFRSDEVLMDSLTLELEWDKPALPSENLPLKD